MQEEEGRAVRSPKLHDFHQPSFTHVVRIPVKPRGSCRTSQWRCIGEGKSPTSLFWYWNMTLIMEKAPRNPRLVRNQRLFDVGEPRASPAEIDWCRLFTLVRKSCWRARSVLYISAQADPQQTLKECFKVRFICVLPYGLYLKSKAATEKLMDKLGPREHSCKKKSFLTA